MVAVFVAAACSDAQPSEDDSAATTGSDPVVAEAASDGDRPAVQPADAETGGAVEDEPRRPPPDTLVWIVATEPPDLHFDDPANGLTITSWIREGLLESLFGVGPDLTYHPELLAAEPAITPQDDASVVIDYRLRSGLTWSDGTPLTAEDVAYTHRIITDGCQVEGDGSILDNSSEGCLYPIAGRVGYDQVTAFEVTSDIEFTVTMAGFYPDWRRLYGPVLAAHAYGDGAGQVNQRLLTMTSGGRPLPTSGPLRLQRWDREQSMTLVANPDYHGSVGPEAAGGNAANGVEGGTAVAAVRIEFEPDPEARSLAMLEGAADLLIERPRPSHESLFGSEDLLISAVPSLDYDHLGMNLLNPHLASQEVRRAVALAIDKATLVEAVHGPLLAAVERDRDSASGDRNDQGDGDRNDGGPPTPVAVQGNTYWLAGQPHYVDNQASTTGGGTDRATALLASAGYQPGVDGVQRHPIHGRLELRFTTIGGDPLRELGQQVLIEQLAEIGVEAVIANPPGGRFFQRGPFDPEAMAASASQGASGDASLWDVAQFGWAGGPWPGAQSGAYRNGSPGNPYGFSNPEFEVRAFECDAVIDDDERGDCYNELDRFVTTLDAGEDGLFMIPLFQRPFVVVWRADRLASLPHLVGAPRGGPLVIAADIVLAES